MVEGYMESIQEEFGSPHKSKSHKEKGIVSRHEE